MSIYDSNPTSPIEQCQPAYSVMTERDYVVRSKRVFGEVLEADQSVDGLRRATRRWKGDIDGFFDLHDQLSDSYERLHQSANTWLNLAYDWVEANNCNASSVRRLFDDLDAWYLPSLSSDQFEWSILMNLTDVNWEFHSPSFRPGHGAILRYMPYRMYLRTHHWDCERCDAVERAGNHCQVCNSAGPLDVHHRTYERRGAELPGDLIVLCRSCHEIFHKNGRLAR